MKTFKHTRTHRHTQKLRSCYSIWLLLFLGPDKMVHKQKSDRGERANVPRLGRKLKFLALENYKKILLVTWS